MLYEVITVVVVAGGPEDQGVEGLVRADVAGQSGDPGGQPVGACFAIGLGGQAQDGVGVFAAVAGEDVGHASAGRGRGGRQVIEGVVGHGPEAEDVGAAGEVACPGGGIEAFGDGAGDEPSYNVV